MDTDSTATYRDVELTNISLRLYNYVWDFGNGETSTIESPVIYYTEPGNYKITLTAYSNNGKRKDQVSENIQVSRSNTIFFDDFYFLLDDGAVYNYGNWDGSLPLTNFDIYLVNETADFTQNGIKGRGRMIYLQLFCDNYPAYGEYSFSESFENKTFHTAIFGVEMNFDAGTGYFIQFTDGTVKISKNEEFDLIEIHLTDQYGYKLESYFCGQLEYFELSKMEKDMLPFSSDSMHSFSHRGLSGFQLQ